MQIIPSIMFDDLSGHLLRPFSIGYIKGYKRCSVLLIVLEGLKELGCDTEVPHSIRVSQQHGEFC